MVNARLNHAESGDTWVEYSGPQPPVGTGPHRYVFLVFKQPRGEKLHSPSSGLFQHRILKSQSKGRGKFTTRSFLQSHSLETHPHAGALFFCEH